MKGTLKVTIRVTDEHRGVTRERTLTFELGPAASSDEGGAK